jgi:hypothetical protein
MIGHQEVKERKFLVRFRRVRVLSSKLDSRMIKCQRSNSLTLLVVGDRTIKERELLLCLFGVEFCGGGVIPCLLRNSWPVLGIGLDGCSNTCWNSRLAGLLTRDPWNGSWLVLDLNPDC